MCSRYVQTKRARAAAARLINRAEPPAPRPETWNLAPSTPSLVVRVEGDALTADWMNWGFGSAQIRPINARIETMATNPLFREAWRDRRCAVPADGWYEWRLERGRKQPYYFARRDGDPVFFAGLWAGQTFSIITTASDGELAQIHNRRPLALPTSRVGRWIENAPPDLEEALAAAVPASEIGFYLVGANVGSPRNDGPDLIARVDPPSPLPETGDLFPDSA